MKNIQASVVTLTLAALIGCQSSNQRQIKKAGDEIKSEAKELDKKIGEVAKPDSKSASDKLHDAAILAEVKTKLASDLGISTLAKVDVSESSGVLRLSGSVATQEQKKAAGVAASQVSGVVRVQNDLTVQP